MAGAIRLSLFEKGADPADFTLVPFGGAAGLHACAVAEELDISRILFPTDASTLSARGILMADLRRDRARSELMMAHAGNLPRIVKIIADLEADARRLLAETGLGEERRRIAFAVDIRYRGQAYEIATPWPGVAGADDVDAAALARLVDAFHQLHQVRYSHSAPEDTVELVTFRASATGVLEAVCVGDVRTAGREDTAVRSRTVFLDGAWVAVPVYMRDDLTGGSQEAGPAIDGPVIIEEDYTVLLIGEGWTARRGRAGDLIATRTEAGR